MYRRAAWQALRQCRAAYPACSRELAGARHGRGRGTFLYATAAATLSFGVAAAHHVGPSGGVTQLEERPRPKKGGAASPPPAAPAELAVPVTPADPASPPPAAPAEPTIPAAPADLGAQKKPEAPPKSEPEAKPKTSTKVPAARGSKPTGTISVDQESLRARRLFLTGDVNDDMARVFTQQLLYLEQEDPEAPVTIYINSGGGSVHSGMAILDIMSSVKMPIVTVAYGRAMSIAALLLAGGTPGRRSAYANTRLMVHEPSCSYPKLQASDLRIKMDELDRTRRALVAVFASRVGRPEAEVAAEIGRDRFLSPDEAKTFGLLDTVLEDPRTPPPQRPALASTALSAARDESAVSAAEDASAAPAGAAGDTQS